jgi:4-hydroxybenzoate polyprenyltransferase
VDQQHREDLQQRAFPAGGVTWWRARIFFTFITAIIAGLALNNGLAFIAILATAVPAVVRYVRQQLALGALIADERNRAREQAMIPDDDVRDAPPYVR